MIINTITAKEVTVVACDTETHTFCDGKLLSERQLKKICKTHSQAWLREHITVQTYAWLVSDGYGFAWCENFDEFVELLAGLNCCSAWWYNAKFDFAGIDYQLLTNDWRDHSGQKGRLGDKSFSSLHGSQGQRYSLKIARARKDQYRNTRAHTVNHYDFCNIFGGGLKKCLESFKVVDYEGTPIRKLEMDYQGEIDENAIAYMKNDVMGLFHLVRIASEWLESNLGYSLMGERPDVMTAGGLAKKMLLRFMYDEDDKTNVELFQREHPMDAKLDAFLREKHLYAGALTNVNPNYANTLVVSKSFEYRFRNYNGRKRVIDGKLYYYDVNSEYPAQMHDMPDLVGRLVKIDECDEEFYRKNDFQIIYEITNYVFEKKYKKAQVFYDRSMRIFTDYSEGTEPVMYFDFELDEIANFYEMQYDVKQVYAIKKKNNPKYREFVDFFYKLKTDGKKRGDDVGVNFAKLMLNSAYGKLSENPMKDKTHREINDETGAVHLVEDGQEVDEKGILSVLQGALVTAMGRCCLMRYIRKIGGENSEDTIIYWDTDSVTGLNEYPDADPYTLGKMKLEGVFECGKWLAPKTYFLTDSKNEMTVHSKGINTKEIKKNLQSLTIAKRYEKFAVGAQFQSLTGMNVRGGKALLNLTKNLCVEDNFVATNYENLIRGE